MALDRCRSLAAAREGGSSAVGNSFTAVPLTGASRNSQCHGTGWRAAQISMLKSQGQSERIGPSYNDASKGESHNGIIADILYITASITPVIMSFTIPVSV